MSTTPTVRTKVSFNVVVEFDQGVTETFTRDDGTTESFDLGAMGAHPFSAGFPTEETTRDTVLRAWEHVRERGSGYVWVERITETVTIERLA